MLTGSSTHNQRIERLWRDMHSCVTLLYYRLFYYLEEMDLLDPLNNVHLWALHYVYLRRINRSLDEFVLSWNNHPKGQYVTKLHSRVSFTADLKHIFPRLLR